MPGLATYNHFSRQNSTMKRRRFVQIVAGGLLLSKVTRWSFAAPAATQTSALQGRFKAPLALQSFDYQGVKLLPGPLADRLAATREFYLSIPDDDTLKGFRERAGLPAPGTHLGGWCGHDSALLFGQWLSGMARLYRATGDTEIRDKALRLMNGWGQTLPKQGFGHYDFDKFVCGLVDMTLYADAGDQAIPLLSQMTDWAIVNLKRDRLNATDADSQGGFFNGQLEWYTLPENLLRAYALTGDAKYRDFADVWRYDHYFGMFNGEVNATPDGFHAYSHLNALSSAAMFYAISGDERYRVAIANAYDFFQRSQCYATGGYGPGEKLMAPNGDLGRSVAVEPNAKYLGGMQGRSFETPCGTWAVFKLVRYLQEFTGEARFGDWMERVLYNGIGAALPIQGRGQTFYYADYRLNGARKYYFDQPFPCCAGTYIQDVADIHNILYFHSDKGLYVNAFVPSQVEWQQGEQTVRVTQTTRYPDDGTINFALSLSTPARFALNFRVPAWAKNAHLEINGKPQNVVAQPGQWLEVVRDWKNADKVTLTLPLEAREVPIDSFYPDRLAYARGPLVLVRRIILPIPPDDAPATTGMVPFAAMGQDAHYKMYFDPPAVELVATSEKSGATWRYTTEKPTGDWTASTYDDSTWKTGPAPFGTMDFIRTRWDSPDIWLRREVTLPATPIVNPQLRMFHDEDTEVFLNGQSAVQTTGYITSYGSFELSPAARTQIRSGASLVIAAHVHQTTGSQLIDLGLIDIKPRPKNRKI